MPEQKKPLLTSERAVLLLYLSLLGGAAAYFAAKSPVFLTAGNLLNLLKHMSVFALAGLGLTFVIVVGYADMSFHFVSCFAGMTMAYAIARGLPPLAAIAIACAAAVAFGAINGLLVGRLKLPDMVATIGVGTIAWGMGYLYSNGSEIYENFRESGITKLSDARLGGAPLPAILMVGAYILAAVVLHRTALGRRFYAIGRNPVAARFSGVKVEWVVAVAFIVSAVLASFANMIQCASQGDAKVNGGLMLLMPAYATVFVGMSLLKKPTVPGTFLGALMIAIVQNGFTLTGRADAFYMDFIVGIALIVSIALSSLDVGKIARRLRLRRGDAA